MTPFAPSYGQESAALHVSERARNHRSLRRPCDLCLQRSRRLPSSQVIVRPGAGARGREGASSACTPGPPSKDHPPPGAPQGRDPPVSPRGKATKTDAGPAGSFWGFYFFKIIHTNGYSHKHDFNQNIASLPRQQDGTRAGQGAAPSRPGPGAAGRSALCATPSSSLPATHSAIFVWNKGVHAKMRKNSLCFVSLNYSKNKTSR